MLFVVGAFSLAAFAQPVAATADEIKAAYLHKFTTYVTWPPPAFESPTSPLVIGVIGSDSIYAELARIAVDRPVQGRPVEVRRLSRLDSLESIHVLFVGNDVPGGVSKALSAVSARPVLTVTDTHDGGEQGAVLNFVSIAGRVRFQASLPAAARGGLEISSRLLSVAERVFRGPS